MEPIKQRKNPQLHLLENTPKKVLESKRKFPETTKLVK